MPNENHSNIGGQINEFVIGDDFGLYAERLEHVLNFNEIEDDKKKISFLIGVGGMDLLKILKSLIAPKKTSEISFDEAIKSLKMHFVPKKNVRAERHKFYSRAMKPEEDISDFIVELKLLADTCDYKDNLDTILSDKFILSMRDESIQRKLIDLPMDTKFEKICETALTMESTRKECKKINEELGAMDLNWVAKYAKYAKKNQQKEDYTCYKCGGKFHFAYECPSKIPYSKREKEEEKSGTEKKPYQKSKFSAKTYSNEANKKGLNKVKSESENSDNDEYTDDDKNLYKQLFLGNVSYDSNEPDDSNNKNNDDILGNVSYDSCDAMNAVLCVNDKSVVFEVDCGAAVTCCSEIFMKKTFGNMKCDFFKRKLSVLTGENVDTRGTINVEVRKPNSKTAHALKLVIIATETDFKPLLGRNWLNVFFHGWKDALSKTFTLNSVKEIQVVNDLKAKFPNVFDKNYNETIKDHTVDIVIKPNSTPIFHKAYTVPYGLRDKVDADIDKLVKCGVIVPVNHSDWASPIVCAMKKDQSVRICMDCKVTINKYVETEHYPLPRLDDTLVGLHDCKIFCIIDLAGAFSQLKVSTESQKYLTINTQKGLFRYTRLPFGVKSAPAIFQEKIDQIIGKMDKVKCYFDDILVGGANVEECKQNLYKVFEALSKFNVKVRDDKCVFLRESVEYLGHVVTEKGIEPKRVKMQAIFDAPSPTDDTTLKAYLGLLNFYSRFIPNLSSKLTPLYNLLAKDKKFEWSPESEEIFQNSKRWLFDSNFLVHYNPDKPIGMVCDSSAYGVGAVLFHTINEKEMPIMFASSTLSKPEKNYAQIHREALAIMFGIKKFHKFIYGRHVDIYTDHQPLEQIFGDKCKIPIVNQRLQRWVLMLSQYDKTVIYRKGSQVANADALSRLPICDKTEINGDAINFFGIVGTIPLNHKIIAQETANDKILSSVLHFVQNQWPPKIEEQLKPYFSHKNDLSIDNGVLIMGQRIIVPKKLQKPILEMLHEGHIGIIRMKQDARGLVWWNNITKDIEQYAKRCDICAQVNPAKPILKQKTYWPPSKHPFDRIHLDFFYFNSLVFLIIVDSYSKWIDVQQMNRTKAVDLVKMLKKHLFSEYGLPNTIVCDNGPPYNAIYFSSFCKSNDIDLLHSPPYNPTSNGLAERGVQTVKYCLKKLMVDPKFKDLPIQDKIDNFLFRYRNTPTTTTNQTPASCLFTFTPKTKLQILRPPTSNAITLPQPNGNKIDKQNQKENQSATLKVPEFKTNENVWYIINYKAHVNKVPATITKKITKLMYEIKINNNRRNAHIRQLRKRNSLQRRNTVYGDNSTYIDPEDGTTDWHDCDSELSEELEFEDTFSTEENNSATANDTIITIDSSDSDSNGNTLGNSRYPSRERKNTSFFGLLPYPW